MGIEPRVRHVQMRFPCRVYVCDSTLTERLWMQSLEEGCDLTFTDSYFSTALPRMYAGHGPDFEFKHPFQNTAWDILFPVYARDHWVRTVYCSLQNV